MVIMEGKILLAIGGCAVVAAVTYVLKGGKKTGRKKKEHSGVPGLMNNGNTCYLNSVLQALASASTFLSWIEIIGEEHENQHKLGKLTSEMLTLMQILNQSCFEQKVYDASVIFESLSSHGWVISREQQDAHEIFQVLLSTLTDEQQHVSQMTWNSVLSSQDMLGIYDESIVLRNGLGASKVQRKSLSPFSGLFGNQMWCKTCSYKYPVKFDSFDTVSLSLSSSFQFGSITLEALITDFMCSEILESFKCSGCGQVNGEKTRLLKKLSIGKLPQCLCFHINRTYWQNGSAYKNNTVVTFSESLDIKPYCYNSSKMNDEIPRVSSLCSRKSTDEKCQTSQSRWMVNTSYTLVAVIIHLGVVEKGHYLTFRKVNNTWYFVSDNNTRVVPLSHVLHSNPYMLFYERSMLADNGFNFYRYTVNYHAFHNVQLFAGRVEQRASFDTHGSTYQSNQMANRLNALANAKQRKVILIAIQNEGAARMTSSLESAIVRVGGTKPVRPAYRGLPCLGLGDLVVEDHWSMLIGLSPLPTVYQGRQRLHPIQFFLAHNRNSPQSHEQRIRAKKIIVHPQYGRTVLNNNIALIQLERAVTITSRISTVCLPDHDVEDPGSFHHTLQQARLPPVSQEACKRKLAQSPDGHRLSISEQMLCAGFDDTILSGCHGDSGGPYVCRDSNNRFVLQGAVSCGSPRCYAKERCASSEVQKLDRLRNPSCWLDEF